MENHRNPSGDMDDEADRQKAKEDWLRQELRAHRTLGISQIQWGVTVLAAVGLNLYYIRRDVTKHLVDLGALNCLLFSDGAWERFYC